MKIAVDIRPLLEPRPGGVPSAARGTARALVDAGADVTLWINSSAGADGADLAEFGGARLVVGRTPNKVLNACLAAIGRPHLDVLAGRPEWFLMPNPNFAAFSPSARVAVVFHDLSFEINRSWYSPRQRLWHRMVNPRSLARRADRIIAVSENTKRDLVDLYRLPEEKVAVVPPVWSWFDKLTMTTSVTLSQSKGDDQPFILFLGEVSRRKNVLGLIRAFESIAASFPEHALIIAGPDGWGASEVEREIAGCPVRDRIRRMGAVSEEIKRQLLARAGVFVYPSFYEGFGLPVVEAMAAGTPVVASHAGSLPEVVGSAGILVDPYDISTIREALAAFLSNPYLASDYSRRGRERAAALSSQSTRGRLLSAFES